MWRRAGLIVARAFGEGGASREPLATCAHAGRGGGTQLQMHKPFFPSLRLTATRGHQGSTRHQGVSGRLCSRARRLGGERELLTEDGLCIPGGQADSGWVGERGLQSAAPFAPRSVCWGGGGQARPGGIGTAPFPIGVC